MPIETESEITDDAVLGGRLRLLQPRRGHRIGHDAILLAAATRARAGETAVDFGAGVGAAGLALARRVPDLSVKLVEIDPGLARLAAENIRRNGLAARAQAVALDITAPAGAFAAAGLPADSADRVLMNPPFNDPERHRGSPDPGRRQAHLEEGETLAAWTRAAARLLRPHGVLTMIVRADAIVRVLAALEPGFGGLAILPIHPNAAAAAIRVIVRAAKGSRAPVRLLPGLVLNDRDGPTPAAEAVLRDGAALPLEED
ncbi:MAG TPA: methyltransferase [Xanthobacteraceae bacterium]|nr:methyltransferase [Xanthobacteraceae bacterium]